MDKAKEKWENIGFQNLNDSPDDSTALSDWAKKGTIKKKNIKEKYIDKNVWK